MNSTRNTGKSSDLWQWTKERARKSWFPCLVHSDTRCALVFLGDWPGTWRPASFQLVIRRHFLLFVSLLWLVLLSTEGKWQPSGGWGKPSLSLAFSESGNQCTATALVWVWLTRHTCYDHVLTLCNYTVYVEPRFIYCNVKNIYIYIYLFTKRQWKSQVG